MTGGPRPRPLLAAEDVADTCRRLARSASRSLRLFAPYVQVDALKAVLGRCAARDVAVVTTWRRDDLLRGSSEPEAYEWCRERGWRFYVHPRLHAKAIVADGTGAVVTSANATRRGLGLVDPPNAEIGVELPEGGRGLAGWAQALLGEATEIDDALYAEVRAALEADRQQLPRPGALARVLLMGDGAPPAFHLSALPSSASPKSVVSFVEALRDGTWGAIPADERERAARDAAAFGLSAARTAADNWVRLRRAFFHEPFVAAFVRFAEQGRYFGECKRWVQEHCADVPRPGRRDLTPHVRILFDWIVELQPDRFAVTRPHVSECISRTHGHASSGGGADRTPPQRATGRRVRRRSGGGGRPSSVSGAVETRLAM